MDAPDSQRLAEMEERLRVLQEQLEADLGMRAEPAPPPVRAPAPERARARSPISDRPPPRGPGAGAAMAGHLVRAMRELLEGYEIALTQADASAARLDVRAGPFADTRSLENFARAVRELPGVLAAEVRGYAGSDRAIVEIELGRGR